MGDLLELANLVVGAELRRVRLAEFREVIDGIPDDQLPRLFARALVTVFKMQETEEQQIEMMQRILGLWP